MNAGEGNGVEGGELYRQVLRTALDGFLRTDARGRFLGVNDAYCRMSGYCKAELLTMSITDLEVQENEAQIALHNREIRERGEHRFDSRHRRKDGSVFDVEVSVRYLDADGGCYVAFLRDVTAQKQMAGALQESRDRLEAILASLADAVFLVDPRTRGIEVCNDAATQIFGYTREELLGQETDFLHVDSGHFESFGRMAEEAYRDPGFYAGQFIMRRKDGSVFPTEHLVRPLRDPGGRILYVVSVVRDITARRRDEEALRKSQAGLAEAQRISRVGSWDWDLSTGHVEWSEEMFRIFGLERDTYDGKPESLLRIIHPDDSGPFVRSMEANRARRSMEPLEYRVIHPDGSERTVFAQGVLVPGAEGASDRIIGTVQDITERKNGERALAQETALLARAEAISHMGSWRLALDTGNVTWSDEMYRIFGLDRDCCPRNVNEVVAAAVHPEDKPMLDEITEAVFRDGIPRRSEYRIVHPDGSVAWVQAEGAQELDASGRVVALAGFVHDITDRRTAEMEKARLEQQLQQAQKMESVGRLAGGVAHDFNNMLGVIMGHAEAALEQVDPAGALHADLREILDAAERSADLTRQLLAFARRQIVSPRVLDLNATVAGMLNMLNRLIGEDILLSWKPGQPLWPVRVDPSQIDQVLANLCVNARDAIAGVGTLVIETANCTLDEGHYVSLCVRDNGCGMDEETRAHLFEPFFTTKGVGKGTGLGLATVYGIVKQNGGFIHVDSEPGRGTAFRVYLPRHAEAASSTVFPASCGVPARGRETILLVEDEPAVLRLAAKMLEAHGYGVFPAATPGEALRLAREHAGGIHLLVTDVVMPEMNGRVLAGTLLSLYPHMRCLFTSGYTADVIADHGVLDAGVHFIEKPYSREGLAASVREVLDAE